LGSTSMKDVQRSQRESMAMAWKMDPRRLQKLLGQTSLLMLFSTTLRPE
jgi:hypothetical protein